MSEKQTTPEVVWAQRSSSSDPERNYITLTISAPDVTKPKIDLKPSSLTFTGYSETKKTTYHVELELYSEIDVDASKTHNSGANVHFQLRKKELKEEYWPRLLKESKRVHYLKTDFDKWVDEDEQDGAGDEDFGGMGGMGGMGGGMPGMEGLGGMGGMGGDGGFGGLDFSKLGGGAGGMPDMGGDDEGEDDDDDDDMPGLEGEDEAAGEGKEGKAEVEEAETEGKGKGKGKIEEVE